MELGVGDSAERKGRSTARLKTRDASPARPTPSIPSGLPGITTSHGLQVKTDVIIKKNKGVVFISRRS